jgi:hypothetical protein
MSDNISVVCRSYPHLGKFGAVSITTLLADTVATRLIHSRLDWQTGKSLSTFLSLSLIIYSFSMLLHARSVTRTSKFSRISAVSNPFPGSKLMNASNIILSLLPFKFSKLINYSRNFLIIQPFSLLFHCYSYHSFCFSIHLNNRSFHTTTYPPEQ